MNPRFIRRADAAGAEAACLRCRVVRHVLLVVKSCIHWSLLFFVAMHARLVTCSLASSRFELPLHHLVHCS